jgi:glycosyl hydrolase family 16
VTEVEQVIADAIAICEVPVPTFSEDGRARAVTEMFGAIGLAGPAVVLAAHLDTEAESVDVERLAHGLDALDRLIRDRCGVATAAGEFFEDFGGSGLDADVWVPHYLPMMGVHPFRDPALTDEFSAPRVEIDVAEFHVYAADWRPGRVDFLIDGRHVKTVHQAPAYPMQMMIAVFDFPEKPPSDRVPELAVDYVRGRATPPTPRSR